MSQLGVKWGEVRLCEWSGRWDLFEAEASRILESCRGVLLEHVGSTAVVALPAKPIIDMLVGVEGTELNHVVDCLAAIGYRTHTKKDRGDRIFLWLGEGDVS